MKKALCILVLVGILAMIVWGVRACAHERAMIASVKEWTFVENVVYPAWTETQWMYIYGANGQISGQYPIFYDHPERRVSIWSGIDAEGGTRYIERAWKDSQ